MYLSGSPLFIFFSLINTTNLIYLGANRLIYIYIGNAIYMRFIGFFFMYTWPIMYKKNIDWHCVCVFSTNVIYCNIKVQKKNQPLCLFLLISFSIFNRMRIIKTVSYIFIYTHPKNRKEKDKKKQRNYTSPFNKSRNILQLLYGLCLCN